MSNNANSSTPQTVNYAIPQSTATVATGAPVEIVDQPNVTQPTPQITILNGQQIIQPTTGTRSINIQYTNESPAFQNHHATIQLAPYVQVNQASQNSTAVNQPVMDSNRNLNSESNRVQRQNQPGPNSNNVPNVTNTNPTQEQPILSQENVISIATEILQLNNSSNPRQNNIQQVFVI